MDKTLIGRAEKVGLAQLGLSDVNARIDTGAKRSAISTTSAKEGKDGSLTVVFAHPNLPSAVTHTFATFERINVASSNGHVEERYMVRLSVELKGRIVRARFTLTDRSSQVYPVLIGRNVLRRKYVVDVEHGEALENAEQVRTQQLQSNLKKEA